MGIIFRQSSSPNIGPNSVKNAELTWQEADGNWAYLESISTLAQASFNNWTGSVNSKFYGTSSLALTASYLVSSSYAITSSHALSASYYGGIVSVFPFTGSASISGSLVLTGSASISGSLVLTGSIQTNNNSYADLASYARSFQPYNGQYGKRPLNPTNPDVTASAAISWWSSDQGAVLAPFGPGMVDVVYYCDQNLGQIGLYNQNNFQNWAGSIKFLNNPLSTDLNNGKVPFHVLITDNATLTDNQAFISVLDANGRRHVLGVTGSFLARDGATIGTNITNQHYITGSVSSTGSFIQNGHVILSQVSRSLNFTDDVTAAAGGVPLGGLYRNGNFIVMRVS
jgi:hypothetical protein